MNSIEAGPVPRSSVLRSFVLGVCRTLAFPALVCSEYEAGRAKSCNGQAACPMIYLRGSPVTREPAVPSRFSLMKPKLAQASVVIVAHHFNPSVVSQLWLADHDIVLRSEFEPGSIFTDMMVNVASKQFSLLVAPDQLQFAPRVPMDKQQALLGERLAKLVETIPHTPYSACGLNFTWHLKPEDIAGFSRNLFFVADSPLHSSFASDNSRFGGYMSCDKLGGRLKLDVKPITAKSPEGEFELMQFGFNFHFDLVQPNPAEQIPTILSKWDEAFDISNEMMMAFEVELQS